jgi:putative ABC transport system substrate-binding protein
MGRVISASRDREHVVRINRPSSQETVAQLQEAAAELVRMNVDVIFATSSAEIEHAKQVTNTILIFFATHADPVGLGHVASLPRPGGNITGLSVQLTETTAKQLEILKETVPQVMRIGVLSA